MKDTYAIGYKDGYSEAIDDVKCVLRACTDSVITAEIMNVIEQLIPMNNYVLEIKNKNENCRANSRC